MASQPVPRIRRTSQNTQFTYNLSRRIHDVQTYPVLSPQGASIIIYGHDSGITVIWRGGRRFKVANKQPPPAAKEKQNGTNDGAVMIIDSDDDAPPAKAKASAPFVDSPVFEEAVEDSPYPQVTQTLDLSLGTAALHIAVLSMAPSASEDAAWGGAEVLKEKMVFAVSCATNEVYLVMLPLTPPSPESKARPELRANLLSGRAGSGHWGESLIFLAGQNKHSEGVAVSLVKPKTSPTSDRIREQAGSSISTPKPRVVVASHTREASGTLRFWDVSLDRKVGADASQLMPFQTEYLPSPLSSISFNPTHMSQLLAVASPYAVRIYDYALPSLPPDDQSTGAFPSQGSWLLSLYQPFARPTATRKPILDAAWIAHGRAVFALLADGTWGIWDVDGASPLGATILGKNSSGIRGAALTVFSATGQVEGANPLRSAAAAPRTSGGGEFVPLTPHSRRDAAASLSAAASTERLAAVKGGIVVTPLPVTGSGSGDEGVVLWVGGLDNVSVIPAVSRFWDAQLRKGSGGGVNMFSGVTPTRMIRLHDLSTGLLGERCCGVGAVVNFPKSKITSGSDAGLPVEILLRGESRLVIVREAEDGPGIKIGGVVSGRRRLFGDKATRNEMSSAIIVHPRPDQPRNVAFNLNISKGGSLRVPKSNRHGRDSAIPEDDANHELTLPTRPRAGFAFVESLSAAADVEDDVTTRDVEVEMLDIMEIDRALEDLEDDRGSGR